MAKAVLCSIDGCGNRGKMRRGLCARHYTRLKAHGDPHGGGPLRPSHGELLQFVDEVVLRFGDEHECLTWPFGKLITIDGRKQHISRYVCLRSHGEPPTSKHEAAHSCGKGHLRCVNPQHLRWATHVENEADKIAHGTRNWGEKNGGAKLSEKDVREIMASDILQTRLAEIYGVSLSAINNIKLGIGWKHITLDNVSVTE